MERVRFGIIGGADIARRRFLPALRDSERAELAAVASRSGPKAEAFAAEFGGDAVTGYGALLDRDDVDAVYVATPNAQHPEWVVAAARRGKHVLCEKSLATTVAEVRDAVAACEASGVALLEGFAYQFHPQHAAVRELVAEGAVGEPLLFQAWFGFPPRPDGDIRYRPDLGGGVLLDAGCYTVHAARRFFRREPVEARATLHHGDRAVDIRGAALLDFGRGQTAQLAFGYEHAYQNTYTIWGTEGLVRIPRAFSMPPGQTATLILESRGVTEERAVAAGDQFRLEIDAFCAGIHDPETRRSWRTDALAQAEALDAIRRGAI